MTHGSRRSFLASSAALGAAAVLLARPAAATPETMREAMREKLGNAAIKPGRVTLDVPPLVENGNTVPMTITVDSPMSDADYVKAIHVFNEKNPQPYVVSAYLSPKNGKAVLSSRIKLADAQRVTAVAEMSDGSFWSAEADVIVTIAACVEDL